MHNNLRTSLAAASFLCGCTGAAGPPGERPAPAGQLVLTTESGSHLTGPAARIDIRVDRAGTPTVELAMSVTDSAGRSWALQAALPTAALESLTLRAQLVQGPLAPGDASVQLATQGGGTATAAAGQLQAHLQGGKILGNVAGAAPELAATFAGPFVVTCAVPASDAPTSTTGGAAALVVDEKFESAACKPYAGLAQRVQ